MLRQWARVGSIATAVLLLLLLVVQLTLWRSNQDFLEQSDGKSADDEAEGQDGGEETNGADSRPQWLQTLKGWAKPPSIDNLLHGQQPTSSSSSLDQIAPATTPGTIAPRPTSAEITKAIVMGRLQTEDTSWVHSDLSDWQPFIYYVDLPANESSPSGLRTKINKSKEAMPYLTYIIDNYPDFPDVSVFVHAHRSGYPQAWHNDAKNYDAVIMLQGLRLDTVMNRGYANLRCSPTPGCPDEIQPYRDPPDPEKLPEQIYPAVYAHFFGLPVAEVREKVEVVATPCCAQFAVSREQILQRPKSEYEKFRRYVEETGYDDDTIGRVLEYMWHVIFGRESVDCETTGRCFCEIYGRC